MTERLPAPARRRQLLDTALEIFADQGFHGASMDDIAAAAGVTKPVLYQHFDSKRALHLAVLEDVGERMLHAILAAVADAGGPEEQVRSGFQAYFGFVDSEPAAFTVLFGAGGSRGDPEFDAVARRVELMVADAVSRLVTADIDEDHRTAVANGLVGLGEVAASQWLAAGQATPAPIVADWIADLAWSGLRGVRPRQ